MKKFFTSVIALLLLSLSSFSQDQEVFSATLKPGSMQNSVIAVLKPNLTFTGQFVQMQLTFQIPNTVLPQPTATIIGNALNAYTPTGSFVTSVTNEGGFYTYLFGGVFAASPTYSFTSGAEIDALEIQFSGNTGATTARLAHLADGGSIGQNAFYVQIGGSDYTNYSSMFYGTGAVNGGSYSAYSYVPLNVVLPLNILNFSATKSGDNAVLNWNVENESSANSYFEIERSVTGVSFTAAGKLNVSHNGSSSNVYSYTDANLSQLRNNGVIYYRLKQVDKDGKFLHSPVRTIKLDNGKPFSASLYPNPALSTSTVTFDITEAQTINLVITDAAGKILKNTSVSAVKGANQKAIDLTQLPAGNYSLIIKSENNSQTIPFVKAQ